MVVCPACPAAHHRMHHTACISHASVITASSHRSHPRFTVHTLVGHVYSAQVYQLQLSATVAIVRHAPSLHLSPPDPASHGCPELATQWHCCPWLQWWCEHDPVTGAARRTPYNASFDDPHASAVAARFLNWYVNEGHVGYTRKVGSHPPHMWWAAQIINALIANCNRPHMPSSVGGTGQPPVTLQTWADLACTKHTLRVTLHAPSTHCVQSPGMCQCFSSQSSFMCHLLVLQGAAAQQLTEWKSDSVLKQCHAALQAQHDRGQLLAMQRDASRSRTKLLDDQAYKSIYKQCKDRFVIKRGEPLPPGMDPQDNTEQATFNLDQFAELALEGLRSSDPLVARDISMLISMSLMCGRGDDARYRLLSELCEPKHRQCIGEAPM